MFHQIWTFDVVTASRVTFGLVLIHWMESCSRGLFCCCCCFFNEILGRLGGAFVSDRRHGAVPALRAGEGDARAPGRDVRPAAPAAALLPAAAAADGLHAAQLPYRVHHVLRAQSRRGQPGARRQRPLPPLHRTLRPASLLFRLLLCFSAPIGAMATRSKPKRINILLRFRIRTSFYRVFTEFWFPNFIEHHRRSMNLTIDLEKKKHCYVDVVLSLDFHWPSVGGAQRAGPAVQGPEADPAQGAVRRGHSGDGQRAVGQEDRRPRTGRPGLGRHPLAVPHPGGHAVQPDPAGVARLFRHRREQAARVLSRRSPHQ